MAIDKWFNYIRSQRVPDSESGINHAYWLYHRSYARSINRNPYLLANEWICSNIAWYLRLPVPPFALMRTGGSARFFASLDFGKKNSVTPDMIPERVAKKLPDLATGIVLFDILIANPDRHEGNLKVDNPDNPEHVEVFDHDYALLGHLRGKGIERLTHVSTRLGLSSGLSNNNLHKIARELTSTEHFLVWMSRISAIPAQFIDSICDEVRPLNVLVEEVEMAAKFLNDRTQGLAHIVRQNLEFFSKIDSPGIF